MRELPTGCRPEEDLLSVTTATWAISVAVTLVPELHSAFVFLAMSITVADAAEATRPIATVSTPTSARRGSL